jgi:predicted nuclease with TOPRIM domain
MIRFIFLLIMCFILPACTQILPQVQKQAVPPDQLNFSLAIDEFRTSHRIDQLQQFKKNYPDSDWAGRAETIILYSLELDRRKAQIEECRKNLEQLQQTLKLLEGESSQLKEQVETMTLTNQQLNQQIEQLKGLLIQLEKRPQ